MKNYEEVKTDLRQSILEQMDYSRQMEDEEVKDFIDSAIIEAGKENLFSLEEKQRMGKELFFELRKLDVLQELLEDNSITEIMINGTEKIFLERSGKLSLWNRSFSNREKLEDVIQQMVSKCNRVVNEASPIVDARLENGARVNIVLSPIAINGPIVTIRRFPDKPIGMEELIGFDALPKEIADFLEKLVIAGYNILISGGTGSGKTTFLNALSHYIPKEERIITIEDSAELQIQGISNLVRLETRNANVENCKEITIRDLIKSALRMRPDRIIVGEVRGAEAVDMIQAFNTGHDGSLSTGHANSAKDMLYRLETMILMGIALPLPAIRRQIASGVDIIIHLGRMRDKTRKVLEIVEVLGMEQEEIKLQTLYRFAEERESKSVKGKWEKRNELENKEKWKQAGF